MKRKIEQWRNCEPAAMATQSQAALTFAFEDAKADILALHEAGRLALEYWADRQQRYKNRAPVWVQQMRAAIAEPQS